MQSQKQISLTREGPTNISLTNSNFKPKTIVFSPDDSSRRHPAGQFVSTQNITGISNFVGDYSLPMNVPTLSTKNIITKNNASRA